MEHFLLDLFRNIYAIPIWMVVLFVFVSACIQQVFPPYPSDTLLLLMGVLAATGVYPWYYLLITYFLGTVLSSIMLYEVGYKYGEKVLSWKLIKKLVDEKSMEKAKNFSKKIEGFAFLVSRFAPGMFTVMLLMGGVVRIKRSTSWIFISLASLIGCGLYFAGGLLIGDNMEKLKAFAQGLGIFGIVLLVAVIVIGVIVFKINKAKMEKENS